MGNEEGRRDREGALSRRGISPLQQVGLKFSAHLATQGPPDPQQGSPSCCGDSIFPSGLILLRGRPLSFTGNALSLIGIEIHSPPFSCRWGFHRKKLLLCFPSLVTVWKSAPHILLYWVKSLLEPFLSMVAEVDQLLLLWGSPLAILLHLCLDLSDCFQ